MGRRHNDPESSRCSPLILLFLSLASSGLVYVFLSGGLGNSGTSSVSQFQSLEFELDQNGQNLGEEIKGCCRGIENLEFWGDAVKWGTDFKFNSSHECCRACKSMCSGKNRPCLCNSWVFCGNREACGSKFGECWLKKQKDSLAPERQEAVQTVSWTSGLVFGKGEGIVGLETEHGTLHIKLLPEFAPYSVAYILELLTLRHCAGCKFYRAENRGQSWDSEGNHITNAPFGPPFALIQGTLEGQGITFKSIPIEACTTVQRGSVAWVDSGPEFFISLANHEEWKQTYTVFGSVPPEDMVIAEKIAELPTTSEVWNNINVSVLNKPVSLVVKRITTNHKILATKQD